MYYRNTLKKIESCTEKNRILKNNITRKYDKLATSLVVYEVQSPRGDCGLTNASYIGQVKNPE